MVFPKAFGDKTIINVQLITEREFFYYGS